MKKETPKSFKQGRIRFRLLATGTWQFDWIIQGKRHRQCGPPNQSHAEATALATELDRTLDNEIHKRGGLSPKEIMDLARGREPIAPGRIAIPIGQALGDAINNRRGCTEAWKRKLRQSATAFLEWLRQEPDPPRYWDELKSKTVQRYADGLADRGLATYSISHLLKPIRLAARYWDREHPEQLPNRLAKWEAPEGRPKKDAVPLSPKQAVAFLDRIEDVAPAQAPIYGLAITLGLRITEAAAIRLMDYNPRERTITIVETPSHEKLKNSGTGRVVPMSGLAVEILDKHLAKAGSLPMPSEPVFTNDDTKPWTIDSLGSAWTRIKGRHKGRKGRYSSNRLEGLDLPKGFSPSKCRHTFWSIAHNAGCDFLCTQVVTGQKPSTVAGRHYILPSWERKQAVVETVANCIEQARVEQTNSGKILATQSGASHSEP